MSWRRSVQHFPVARNAHATKLVPYATGIRKSATDANLPTVVAANHRSKSQITAVMAQLEFLARQTPNQNTCRTSSLGLTD
jgi:hypothetical protein